MEVSITTFERHHGACLHYIYKLHEKQIVIVGGQFSSSIVPDNKEFDVVINT